MKDSYKWYGHLKKPSWSPPRWLFGPVWSVLYIIIVISFGKVFLTAFNGESPWVITIPFLLNLVFNILFTPIQFGLRNNELAAIDILAVLTTLIWSMLIILPYTPWVAYINIPYLLWVSFATVLQLTITYLNR